MARTLLQRFVGDVRVVVRCAARPTTEEFDAHVTAAVECAPAMRVVLVVLVGDASEMVFDAQQRAKLWQAGLFSRPHALLAPLVRSEIVTTMTWIGANIRPFGPHQLDDACDFLEIAAPLRLAVGDVVASMKFELAVKEPQPSG